MSDRWSTRVPGGQPQDPGVPERPADLAAATRVQRRKRRDTSEQDRRERERQQHDLTVVAVKVTALAKVRRAALSRPVKLTVAAAAAVAFTVLFAVPKLLQIADPPFSGAELRDNRRPLDAAAAKYLGAPAGTPNVSATGTAFTLRYRVPAGRRMYAGGTTVSACHVTFRVNRRTSKNGQLDAVRTGGRRCRRT
jgi:hypothetical protein